MRQVRCRHCNSLNYPAVCSVCGRSLEVPTARSGRMLLWALPLLAWAASTRLSDPAPLLWVSLGLALACVALTVRLQLFEPRSSAGPRFLLAMIQRAAPVPPDQPTAAGLHDGDMIEVYLDDWGYTVRCHPDEVIDRSAFAVRNDDVQSSWGTAFAPAASGSRAD